MRLDNFDVVNAILHVAANGCKWRALPSHYERRHTICMRMSRWAKAGVLDRLFKQLQRQRLMHVRIEAVSLNSTLMKVYPDGMGAPKKTAHRPLDAAAGAGRPSFIWLPRVRAMSSPGV